MASLPTLSLLHKVGNPIRKGLRRLTITPPVLKKAKEAIRKSWIYEMKREVGRRAVERGADHIALALTHSALSLPALSALWAGSNIAKDGVKEWARYQRLRKAIGNRALKNRVRQWDEAWQHLAHTPHAEHRLARWRGAFSAEGDRLLRQGGKEPVSRALVPTVKQELPAKAVTAASKPLMWQGVAERSMGTPTGTAPAPFESVRQYITTRRRNLNITHGEAMRPPILRPKPGLPSAQPIRKRGGHRPPKGTVTQIMRRRARTFEGRTPLGLLYPQPPTHYIPGQLPHQ